MKHYLMRVIRILLYASACMITLAALFVTVARFVAPIFDSHKHEIEVWASKQLNLPVTIRKAAVTWSGYQPGLTLTQVTVKHKLTNEPVLQVQEIRLLFSPIKSLWYRTVAIGSIVVTGSTLLVQQASNGEVSIKGFPTLGGFSSQPYSKETNLNELWAWLMSPRRLQLNNIYIKYTAGQISHAVTLYHFGLQNIEKQHSIYGQAILHQLLPTEITVAASWKGQHADLQQIDADGYVYFSGISLTQWLQGRSWQQLQIMDGLGSVKAWGAWRHGHWQKMQASFQAYNLVIKSDNNHSRHRFNRVSASLGWEKTNDGDEVLAGDDIFIDMPEHLWPVTQFRLRYHRAADQLVLQQLNLAYLDISDVSDWLLALPKAMLPGFDKLKDFNIDGSLEHLGVVFNHQDYLQSRIDAKFNDIGTRYKNNYPSFDHLSGHVLWDGHNANALLMSKKLKLNLPQLFKRPLPINELTGVLQVSHEPEQWQLKTTSLQINNNDLAADISGDLFIKKDKQIESHLQAKFAMPRASHIAQYLPLKVFSNDLSLWLEKAFLSGEVLKGEAKLEGALDKFPFRSNEGLFEIKGYLNHVNFQFAPTWPMLRDLSGELIFRNKHMIVNIDHGQTQDILFNRVQAVIPDLGAPMPYLEVQAQPIQVNFGQANNYLNKSPISALLQPVFANLQVEKPFKLQLGLHVPLNQAQATKVAGHIYFDGNLLHLQNLNLNLTELQGQLNFTEQSLEIPSIIGRFFNHPLQISARPAPQRIAIEAKSVIEMNQLAKWLALPVQDYANGQAAFTADISIPFDAVGRINLHSDLQGVSINLMQPYAKTAAEKRTFTLEKNLNDNILYLHYENLLQAALQLSRENNKNSLSALHLVLGDGNVSAPQTNGLTVSGKLSQFILDDFLTALPHSEQTALLPLKHVSLSIDVLRYANYQFNQLNFDVQPGDAAWFINITGPDVSGSLQVPNQLQKTQKIIGRFKRFTLPQTIADANTEASKIDWQNLPMLDLQVDELLYHHLPLRHFNLQTSAMAEGIKFNKFDLDSPLLSLQATGSYELGRGSQFAGRAATADLTGLLNGLDFTADNFIASKARLDFALHWPDLPQNVQLVKLKGTAQLAIEKGRIINIDAATSTKMDIGRMLSLFSLQTIPRRLSLDFSDLFQSGYSFDKINGHFELENGDIFTHDLRLDGPVAKVGIAGRIGLAKKDYDLQLQVIPYVTSSIPVAATLLTGQPLIGLAAFAVNSLLSPQVSKASTYYYEVNGPWRAPQWQAITAAPTH